MVLGQFLKSASPVTRGATPRSGAAAVVFYALRRCVFVRSCAPPALRCRGAPSLTKYDKRMTQYPNCWSHRGADV